MDSSSDDFTRPEPGGDSAAPHGSSPPDNDPATPAPPDGRPPAVPAPPAGPAPAEGAPLTPPGEPGEYDWDVNDGEIPGEGPFGQGLWLTASAWLPPELLSAGAPAAGLAGLAGFGQGGVLDQLPPGPVLASFLAEKAGGLAGTGVTPPPADTPHADGPAGPAQAAQPQDAPASDLFGPAQTAQPQDPGPADERTGSTPTGGPQDRPRGETPGPAASPRAAETPGAARCSGPAEAAVRVSCPPSNLSGLSDDELTGLIRGWRKQASAAQAGELAAVAELAARRHAETLAAGFRDSTAADGATDEVAAALTLTGRAAELLTDRARTLHDLPRTFAALAAGRLDLPRALVLITGLAGQDPALARTVEAEVLGRAGTQTTGQLRAALTRALLAAGPAAADRRRQHEEQHARIEQLPEPGGLTGTLAGRFLPVPATVAAWNRITALARQLKAAGAPGTLDELRVHVYLTLLTGQPTPTPARGPEPARTADGQPGGESPRREGVDGGTRPTGQGPAAPSDQGPADDSPDQGPADPADQLAADPADQGPAAAGAPAGDRSAERGDQSDPGAPAARLPRLADLLPVQPAGLTGTINLTVPLTTLLGLAHTPGELGGFGPITAHTAREVAAAALDSAAVRWCVTVTGDSGQAVGHGCARRPPPARGDPGQQWAFTVKLEPLASIGCGHDRESSHYRPPPSLWHLIQIRNQRCTYPGCRMPAARCDDEHTVPYGQGGRTCECNLGPVCRHHHRVKQLEHWRLEQPEPGVLAWVTPAGWKYFTGPADYPA